MPACTSKWNEITARPSDWHPCLLSVHILLMLLLLPQTSARKYILLLPFDNHCADAAGQCAPLAKHILLLPFDNPCAAAAGQCAPLAKYILLLPFDNPCAAAAGQCAPLAKHILLLPFDNLCAAAAGQCAPLVRSLSLQLRGYLTAEEPRAGAADMDIDMNDTGGANKDGLIRLGGSVSSPGRLGQAGMAPFTALALGHLLSCCLSGVYLCVRAHALSKCLSACVHAHASVRVRMCSCARAMGAGMEIPARTARVP